MAVEFLFDESCRWLSNAAHLSVDSSDNAVWIIPTEHNFSPRDWDDVYSTTEATDKLIWCVSDGGAYTPRIRERKRALGAWGGLSTNVVRAVEIEEHAQHPKYYSDVAVADRRDCVELASFSSRSTFGVDSAIAFAPSGGKTQDIAECFSAYEQLFVARQLLAAIQRTDGIDKALLSYVSCVLECGGSPGLVFRDSDSAPMIAAIGLDKSIDAASVVSLSAHRLMQQRFEHGLDLAVYT